MPDEIINYENKEQLKNMVSWNQKIENNIISLGQKSKGYKIMHIQESRKLSTYYEWLMYFGIILGPMSGLLSGIGSTLNPDAPTTFPIISACVAFMSGIFVAITKFGKFDEKSTSHKLAASKYTSLESNVSRQLTISRDSRLNAVQYLEYVGKSFDELFTTSPLVSRTIYEKYIKIAAMNGLCVPDEYNIKIDINTPQLSTLFNNKNTSVEETKEMQKDQVKRSSIVYSNIPELNKYSDGRMEYEMNRLLELSK